jgi:hypothetical protein
MSITQETAGKYILPSTWLTPLKSGDHQGAGPADTIFSLCKPDGWQKGQHKVELSINGKLSRTVPFTVR